MRRLRFRSGVGIGLSIGLAAGVAWAGAVASARAGAWTPEAGHGEIIVTTAFEQSNTSFNQVGRITPSALYRSVTVGAYIDYGLNDWLAALIKPSLQSSTLGAPENQRYTGLGDSEIGAQARLWRDDSSVLAAQVSVRAPNAGGATNSSLAGTKCADYDFRLLFGKNFGLGLLPAFMDLQAGARLRGGPAPNEARADLTLGVYLSPAILLLAQSFNIYSAPSSNPSYPQWGQSKAQFSLVYSLDADWRVQLGGFATLAGQNAYRENGALAAVWRRF
jgi:hypothetical protein